MNEIDKNIYNDKLLEDLSCTDPDLKEMGHNITIMVNNYFSFDPEYIIDRADDIQSKNLLVLATVWINSFSDPTIYYDDRNEQAILLCREIRNLKVFDFLKGKMEEDDIYPKYRGLMKTAYNKYGETLLCGFHRTNQQTMTKFMFRVLDLAEDPQARMIARIMRENHGSNWYRLRYV